MGNWFLTNISTNCLFSASRFKIFMPFKDDVTAFAKLEPTDRVQHVVCEAKNEVRKRTKKMRLEEMFKKMRL